MLTSVKNATKQDIKVSCIYIDGVNYNLLIF